MSYATLDQLREYLPQAPAGAKADDQLTTVLARANAMVESVLTFSFAGYATVATAKKIMSPGGLYLHVPGYQVGSVTKVEYVYDDWTYEYDDWEAEDDPTYLYRSGGWPRGRYQVTAKWGYGTAPAEIVQVELELAVNLWRSKDRGMWTDIIGVEGGGAVGYARALTNAQRMILDNVRAKYLGGQFG